MENEKENLNTEENDIAGNRIDGPLGNTAAKPGRPGTGVGIPGGAPAAPWGGSGGSTTPPSSEALAASEMSVGQGAAEPGRPQENKEASPAALTPAGTYGGNFSNSTQGSYHDEDRRENQDSDANRGEFGAQDLEGTTHGGFGNQNRQADYEPRGSAEDMYYGGPGRPGPQENAYRAYDGRNERADSRSEYGFERGAAHKTDQAGASAHLNDNGAPKGSDSGFAADYGRTSLQGEITGAASSASELTTPGRRNQTEDYQPAVVDAASGQVQPLNRQAEGQPQNPTGFGGGEQQGATSGEPAKAPDFRTGDDRSGYVQAASGDVAQGIGSRGGSYNDAYDDSRPDSTAGSPAAGDQRREDLDSNYGQTARQENRPDDADAEDHGTPHRNAGRDGEGK